MHLSFDNMLFIISHLNDESSVMATIFNYTRLSYIAFQRPSV